jgi:hypothetical protein
LVINLLFIMILFMVINNSNLWTNWILVLIGSFFGLGCGMVVRNTKWVGRVFTSSLGGFTLGLLLYNAILYKVLD